MAIHSTYASVVPRARDHIGSISFLHNDFLAAGAHFAKQHISGMNAVPKKSGEIRQYRGRTKNFAAVYGMCFTQLLKTVGEAKCGRGKDRCICFLGELNNAFGVSRTCGEWFIDKYRFAKRGK